MGCMWRKVWRCGRGKGREEDEGKIDFSICLGGVGLDMSLLWYVPT